MFMQSSAPSSQFRHQTTSMSVEIDKLVSNHHDFVNAIIEYMHHTEEIAVSVERDSNIGTDSDPEEQQAHKESIEQLEDCIKVYVTQMKRIEEREQSLQRLSTQCSSEIPDNLVQKFDQIVQQEHGEINEEELRKSERYRKFMNAVWEVHHPNEVLSFGDDDDDLVMGAGAVNIYCPITKTIMEEPVKSRKCGHVYDKPNIILMIHRGYGGECDCPVAGCTATVREGDLVRDREVELEIEKEVRKQKQRATQQTDDAIELDDEL